MKICHWCREDEANAEFIGRICDKNPTGDFHEMVTLPECFECDKPATDGRLCTFHSVQNKS